MRTVLRNKTGDLIANQLPGQFADEAIFNQDFETFWQAMTWKRCREIHADRCARITYVR